METGCQVLLEKLVSFTYCVDDPSRRLPHHDITYKYSGVSTFATTTASVLLPNAGTAYNLMIHRTPFYQVQLVLFWV